jgi:hypothetical protein
MPLYRVYADLRVWKVVEADSEDEARDVFTDDIPYPQCAMDPDSEEEGTIGCDMDNITEVEPLDENEEDGDDNEEQEDR